MASAAVIVANWLAFLVLFAACIGLLVFALKYKGPTGKEAFYNGYRERNMVSVMIHLFAAIAYLARIIAIHTNDTGFTLFTQVKYFDYVTTCPLLTFDLLQNLEAPYKYTAATLVMVCLTMGVAMDLAPPPGNYVWFGVDMVFFAFEYTFILLIVKQRLSFFTECARDSNAKKSIGYLKMAVVTYFGLWIVFPLLWLIGPKAIALISEDVLVVFHAILDVLAKSCYGFALLYFKVFFDRKMAVAGVDEDDFNKFSKAFTTKQDEEEANRRKKDIRLPTTPKMSSTPYGGRANRDGGDSDSDLELGGGLPVPMGSPGKTKSMPRTNYSTRSAHSLNPASGFKRASSRRSSCGLPDELLSMQIQRPASNMIPPIGHCNHDDPATSDDEAAFVERARQEYAQMMMTRAREQRH